MNPLKSCELELSRYFNKYYKYCASSDADDLKDLLSVMCSACEKLEKVKQINFGKNNRYRALKALRNFATHESELLNSSKAISMSSVNKIYCEVQLMSLLPISVLSYVTGNLKSKETINYLNEVIINYGKYVDIYPAIFNFTVDLYFEILKNKLKVDGPGFESLRNSINYEKENGFPHYIKGVVVMLDGSDVNDFIESEAISIESRSLEYSKANVCENGLYSFMATYDKNIFEVVADMKKENKQNILNLLLDSGVLKTGGGELQSTRPLNPVEVAIVNEHFNGVRKMEKNTLS